MSQNTPFQKNKQRAGARIYCVPVSVKKEFTVLETCLIEILERSEYISDIDIAKIMCLKKDDVPVIIEGIGDNEVYGDHTMRSLNSDFNWNIHRVAIATERNMPKLFPDVGYKISKFLEARTNVRIPRKVYRRFVKLFEGKAKNIKTYILEISLSAGKFQCDGDSIPKELEECLKNIFEKR